MSRGELSSPVEVRVGACLCAGTPHPDGDVVFLAAKLPTEAGHAAVQALAKGGNLNVTVLAAILRHGAIVAWNFTDEKGSEVLISPTSVDRYLPWNEGGKEVAAKANKLYTEDGNSPFSSRASQKTSKNSSPSTPTARPTSPARRSSSKRRRSSGLRSVPASDGVPSPVSP